MKVILASPSWFSEVRGGAERYVNDVYNYLSNKVDYDVVSGFSVSNDGFPEKSHLIKYKAGTNYLIKHLMFNNHLRRVAKTIRPDLVHGNTLSCYAYKPTLLDLHLMNYTKDEPWFLRSWIYRLIAKKILMKAARIKVHTSCFKDQIVKFTGINPDKIVIIKHPIDINYFKSDNKMRLMRRKELGIEDKFVFYYPMRYTPSKKQDHLIKSLKFLDKEILSKIHVLFSGTVEDSSYHDYLLSLVDGLPISILGSDNLLDNYNACDCVVHPRDTTESGGTIIAEGMCLGKPVLASDVTSFREVACDNALFFEPGNLKDLAVKLNEMYSNKNLRDRLVEKGKQVVNDNYMPGRYIKEMLDLYASVAKK